MIRSGAVRLRDAENTTLSLESRFDLAYNAAHALSLAALRWKGYRSDNRYIAFQALPHTLGLGLQSGGCLPPAISVAMHWNTRVIWRWTNAS